MSLRRQHASPHERIFHLTTLVAVAYGVIILGIHLAPPLPKTLPERGALRVTIVSVHSLAPPRHAIVVAQVPSRGAGRIPRALPSETPLPSGGIPSPGSRQAQGSQTSRPRRGTGPHHGRSETLGHLSVLTSHHGKRAVTTGSHGQSGSAPRFVLAHLVQPDTLRLPPVRSVGRPMKLAGAGHAQGWPAVSARAARYARYLDVWRRRVERIGDAVLQAHGVSVHGQLRLEVELARNGTIVGTELLEPAATPALNTLALEILHRAEPFPPIPPGVLGRQRDLRFVYLWRFDATATHLRP